jgi:hypothetical protein
MTQLRISNIKRISEQARDNWNATIGFNQILSSSKRLNRFDDVIMCTNPLVIGHHHTPDLLVSLTT